MYLINILLFGCITMKVYFYYYWDYYCLHGNRLKQIHSVSDLLGRCGRSSGVQVWIQKWQCVVGVVFHGHSSILTHFKKNLYFFVPNTTKHFWNKLQVATLFNTVLIVCLLRFRSTNLNILWIYFDVFFAFLVWGHTVSSWQLHIFFARRENI